MLVPIPNSGWMLVFFFFWLGQSKIWWETSKIQINHDEQSTDTRIQYTVLMENSLHRFCLSQWCWRGAESFIFGFTGSRKRQWDTWPGLSIRNLKAYPPHVTHFLCTSSHAARVECGGHVHSHHHTISVPLEGRGFFYPGTSQAWPCLAAEIDKIGHVQGGMAIERRETRTAVCINLLWKP